MDKVRKLLGGNRRKADDLELLQNNLLTGLSQTLKSLLPSASTGCILSGLQTTIAGASISWTAGFIFFEGEIYEVAAGTLAYAATNSYYFVVNSTLDKTRVKLNGASEAHWERRSAGVASSVTPPAGVLLLTASTMRQEVVGEWREETDISSLLTIIGISAYTLSYTSPASLGDTQNRIVYHVADKTLQLNVWLNLILGGNPSNTAIGFFLKMPGMLQLDALCPQVFTFSFLNITSGSMEVGQGVIDHTNTTRITAAIANTAGGTQIRISLAGTFKLA